MDKPAEQAVPMPQPKEPMIFEKVMIMGAGIRSYEMDGHTVLQLITPAGRSYEIPLNDEGKQVVIRALTGGIVVPTGPLA